MSLPIRRITQEDKTFPPLLKEIPGAPKEIFYMGHLPEESEVMVAIVGTRKATRDGLALTKEMSRDLSEAGIIIVSGLALGIDGAAHEGALFGRGRTIAVLGNGLDSIYPAEHHNLAKKILEKNGCIISEYPEGTPSYPNQFLERNRIISGLSLAVIVIEAPIRSGSLVTAKHALEQGREVFVVPGPAGHPNYEGSHILIRNGARLVTNAKEILEDLQFSIPQTSAVLNIDVKVKPSDIQKLDEAQLTIFKAIQETVESPTIDKIIEITKLKPNIVNQELTFLMLQGLIEEKNGKFKILK